MPLFCCLVRDPASPSAPGALEAIARACSPRVELHGAAAVVFDVDGLTRVRGEPAKIAAEVRRLAANHGLTVRLALAKTAMAAWLLAHAQPGSTIAAMGMAPDADAATIGTLPIHVLDAVPGLAEAGTVGPSRRRPRRGHFHMASGPPASPARALAGVLATLERWGLRTLSDVARLSRAELHTRFGDLGVRLHQAACGEDAIPLVPADVAPRFVERLELEWPIEGLEPLSFVLARLSDALSAALARADRGAIVVTTRLALVTRACHERRLELPAPMRDARVLRTLILLDLEAHPPAAGIDVVEIECDVAPGRIVQGSLLARAWPSPETLSTLVARLSALMGETRIGAPLCVDTHDERRCAMGTFKILEKGEGQRAEGRGHRESSKAEGRSGLSIRRFRHPLAVRVTAERGVPVRVERRAGFGGGRVARVAGPWRTSGHWWMGDESAWDREAWDVTLADGGTYRLARDRRSTQWHIEGVFD